jgi:hypothetical protein
MVLWTTCTESEMTTMCVEITCCCQLLLLLLLQQHLLRAAVNYAPSFEAGAARITVAEGSPAYSAAWATNISAGPGDDEDVSLAIECDAAAGSLFAAGPAISAAGVLSFTPARFKSGSSRCSVTLAEAGAGGLSANASLVIEVTAGAAGVVDSCQVSTAQQQQQQQQRLRRCYADKQLGYKQSM